jgi:hypothetical protein
MTLPQAQPLDANGRTVDLFAWDATNNQLLVPEAVAGAAASGQQFSYGALKFAPVASVPTSATLQNAATGDGNGTDFDITGMATVQVTIIPTSYTGTVTFRASQDGTNFDVITGQKQGTSTQATSVANPGSTVSIWEFQVAGLTKFRAALSSSGGTSITVKASASPFPNNSPIGITLSSAVLAAGSALVGGVNVVDSAGTNQLGVDSSHNAFTSLKLYNGVAPTLASADGATAANTPLFQKGGFNGATVDRERVITKFVQIKAQAITASTPYDAYTPTTGKKFRILGYDLGSSANAAVLFEDTTGVEVLRSGTIAANSGRSSGPMGNGYLSTAANNHLFLDVTSSATLNGWIGICEE